MNRIGIRDRDDIIGLVIFVIFAILVIGVIAFVITLAIVDPSALQCPPHQHYVLVTVKPLIMECMS
jgi:hypothetical protein